ncbi:hypothetical protein EVAR_81397_1 [Eumeta japonica]|uniref:Uncharacterized protein n=1 Tax=Eumeta variegata TaxID=151549 RepID=A0A4C1WEJ4_EUMVA|nr:hypothetical protein EVAR_81397_1 [Eumeta japonica]
MRGYNTSHAARACVGDGLQLEHTSFTYPARRGHICPSLRPQKKKLIREKTSSNKEAVRAPRAPVFASIGHIKLVVLEPSRRRRRSSAAPDPQWAGVEGLRLRHPCSEAKIFAFGGRIKILILIKIYRKRIMEYGREVAASSPLRWPLPLQLPLSRAHCVRYPIPSQETGNALVTSLLMGTYFLMSSRRVGESSDLFSDCLLVCPSNMLSKKKSTRKLAVA